jgi:hypothetical protein
MAAAISSTTGGNWSSTTTWSPAQVPADGDTVTIVAGHTVTVDADTATLNLLDVAGTLVVSAGKVLSTSGNITETGTGALTVNGTLKIVTTSAITVSLTLLTGKTFSVLDLSSLFTGSIVHFKGTVNNIVTSMTFPTRGATAKTVKFALSVPIAGQKLTVNNLATTGISCVAQGASYGSLAGNVFTAPSSGSLGGVLICTIPAAVSAPIIDFHKQPETFATEIDLK